MSRDFHPSTVEGWRHDLAEQASYAQFTAANRDKRLAEARDFAGVLATHEARMADLRHLLREADPEHAEDYAEPETSPVGEREGRLADFRALLEFWEITPDLEIPSCAQVSLTGVRTLEDVDRAAALLGVEAREQHGYRTVQRDFGSAVYLYGSVKLPPEPDAVAPLRSCVECGSTVSVAACRVAAGELVDLCRDCHQWPHLDQDDGVDPQYSEAAIS